MGTIPKAGFGDPLIKARRERRFGLWRSTVLHPAMVLVLLVLGVGTAVAWQPGFGVGVVALGLGGAWWWADTRAADEWWARLLATLKMESEFAGVEPLTPLLRSGQEREVLRSARDDRRRLLLFRSTDVSRIGEDDAPRRHHDFTCVLYRDPAPTIRFLSAHEHKVSWAKWVGDDLRGETIGGVEPLTVESVDLHERFELRSSDGQRARMLFTPSFMVWFARQGVSFEYEGGDLVVFVDRILEHAEEFKLLLSRADQIHEALSGAGRPR